jgi:hypothetical protein
MNTRSDSAFSLIVVRFVKYSCTPISNHSRSARAPGWTENSIPNTFIVCILLRSPSAFQLMTVGSYPCTSADRRVLQKFGDSFAACLSTGRRRCNFLGWGGGLVRRWRVGWRTKETRRANKRRKAKIIAVTRRMLMAGRIVLSETLCETRCYLRPLLNLSIEGGPRRA